MKFLPEIVLRGSFPLWLAILLMVLAAGLAVAFYFSESMKIGRGRRAVLAGLRALILASIVFLLCKPVLVRDVQTSKNRGMVVLVDNSQSMTQKDPRLSTADRVRVAIAYDRLPPDRGVTAPGDVGALSADRPSRADMVRATLNNKRLNLLPTIRQKGPLQPYLFGSRSRGLPDTVDAQWLSNVTADDPRTQLTDSIADLLQRDDADLPAAIFLVTDGRDNGSSINWEEVAELANKSKVPINVFGVGGSAAGFLQLKDAAIQDTLVVEDTVRVPFRFRAQGIRDGEVELNLTLGGRVVATKRVPVTDGQDVTEVLTFTPTKEDASAGKQELVASVKITQGGEVLEDRFAKNVRVADRKVKMLYIESNPRWEFKFMQRAFLRDRRVDPTFIIINGDRKALESGAPFLPNFPDQRKDLFAFDMLVIGDVDANYFTPEQRSWIVDFVAEGGGLVVIAGRLHAPATWLGTPLADVLPVEVPSVKFPIDENRRPADYKPLRSEFGKRSMVLSLADDPAENERAWEQFPGFFWNYPVTKLRPAAVSLLDHPREKIVDDKPMPLIATHYYGKGIVMFSAIEETWRWRYNEADKYFGRYWGQVVYAIGLPHTLGTKGGQLAIAGGEAVVGKPNQVYARLFTNEYRPLTKERVVAQMEHVDAPAGEGKLRTVVFEAVPNQPGEYVATVPNDRVGRYNLKVDSGEDSATLDFRVTLPPEHEMAPGPMNEGNLRTLAEKTGGKFYREEDLHRLGAELQPRTVELTQRRETLLWNNWWVLGLVVSLFTAEWLVRKFSNMS